MARRGYTSEVTRGKLQVVRLQEYDVPFKIEKKKIVRAMRAWKKRLNGTILDLRGSVRPSAHPEDFEKIRQSVKLTLGKRYGGGGSS